jgi:hypothetical protein
MHHHLLTTINKGKFGINGSYIKPTDIRKWQMKLDFCPHSFLLGDSTPHPLDCFYSLIYIISLMICTSFKPSNIFIGNYFHSSISCLEFPSKYRFTYLAAYWLSLPLETTQTKQPKLTNTGFQSVESQYEVQWSPWSRKQRKGILLLFSLFL